MHLRRLALAAVFLFAGGICWAGASLNFEIQKHKPCNLFSADSEVVFDATLRCDQGGQAELDIKVVNYFGETIVARTATAELAPNQAAAVPLKLGTLAPGHYVLSVTATRKAGNGASAPANQTAIFGVARFVNRTAKEVREGGYRFGLKTFLIGDPGVWWRRPLVWNLAEVVDASALLGLQWTRHLFNQGVSEQPGIISTLDLIQKHPMNVVLKIESFPPECFDEGRYGPLDEFKKQNPPWNKCSLPKEGPYKDWLRAQLQTLPPEQNVFEIWNEPWQWEKTLPAEDFAKLCNWIAAVVQETRPNAILGPNIFGDPEDYDLRFIKAGGLKGMKMVATHPYTAGSPEAKNFRLRIRNYHYFLALANGADLDLYSTEYGWSTAPQGDRSVNETEQARRTVRESLMLYAEDLKTLIPHWMGDREHDPKDREHWFSFFHITQEPKPVVMAFATCARMIDGSRFVGDLWIEPGVGAMLFERAGTLTLALWTDDRDKQIRLDVQSDKATRVDLMGRETPLKTQGGIAELTVTQDAQYLVGVGKALAGKAIGPSQPLSPDLWRKGPRANRLSAPRLKQPPTIDGKLDDWQGPATARMEAPKIQLEAEIRLGWDEKNLYVAVKTPDLQIVNRNPPEGISAGDVLDFRVCSQPLRQIDSLFDYRLLIAPTSATGKPALVFRNVLLGSLVNPDPQDKSGIRWAVAADAECWTAEAAIPFALLRDAKPRAGETLSFLVAVFDKDTDHPDEWKTYHRRVEHSSTKAPPEKWPLLVLGE